jgi:hypothetical protein
MAGFEREQGSLAVQTCTDAFCFYFVHVERHLDACQFIKLNSIKIIQEGSLLGPTNFALPINLIYLVKAPRLAKLCSTVHCCLVFFYINFKGTVQWDINTKAVIKVFD